MKIDSPPSEISDARPFTGADDLGAADAPARRGTFRALRHRNYRLFFFGQMISVIGTWMQVTAIQLLVLSLFDTPEAQASWLGAVGFVPLIPLIPFALVGGSLADRLPRRSLVVVTQSTMMAVAFALYAITASGAATIWLVLGLLFVQGAANAVDIPARQTLVFELVGGKDDLTSAIALNSSVFNLGRALGPALAGILVAAVGVADAFLLNGLSFVAVLAGLLLTRLPRRDREEKPPRMGRHLREGFGYIKREKTISILLSLIAVTAFLAMPFTQMLPLFAKYTLAESAAPVTQALCSRIECATPEALTLGLLNAFFGLGALVGALSVASWAEHYGRGRVLTLGNVGFPAVLLLFALSRSIGLSLGLLFFVGVGWVMQTTLTNTLLQITSLDSLRGRVMSVYSMLFQGMWRVGSMAAGLVAALVGAPFAVGLGAALALAYGVYAAVRHPRIRRVS